MLAARIPIYRSLCDYPIDITGNRPASQVAEEIVGLLWSRDEAVMEHPKLVVKRTSDDEIYDRTCRLRS